MGNLLQLQKAQKSFGGKVLFDQASFSINEGEHVGLIGANGAGKTTLFKCLVGIEEFSGQLIKRQGLRIGYLAQEEEIPLETTGEELLQQKATLNIWELKKLGLGLGLTDDLFAKPLGELSGGFRMRFRLLGLLGAEPDLLLLDEPTNYLDLESLVVLEKFLIDFKGGFLLISHDREFLRRTTDHTLEIEDGEMTKFPGNIDDYFEQKAQLRDLLAKTAQSLESKRQQILSFTTRFGAKASKAKQAQSKLKMLDKMPTLEVKALPIQAQIRIPTPSRTGKQPLQIHKADFGYEDKKVLSQVDLNIQIGDHVAIVGVNGAGKSTLLKGLAKVLPPLSGEVSYGYQVSVGHYHQHVAEALNLNKTIFAELCDTANPDITEQEIKDLAGSFLFSGSDIQKSIRVLSGGEKARVALAQILLQKAPVLLLDEPTNHLDFHTVEALTEALKSYEGTVVVVSHDRSFIQRIASKIIEIRNGRVDLYPGSYEEYVWSLQKGAWSDKTINPEASTKSLRNMDPEKKFNYKAARKTLEKEIRKIQKEIQELETKMEAKKAELNEMNEKILQVSGLEAQGMASDLNRLQKEIEKAEERWIAKSELSEEKAKELEGLLN